MCAAINLTRSISARGGTEKMAARLQTFCHGAYKVTFALQLQNLNVQNFRIKY
jgi:hypothetical protein